MTIGSHVAEIARQGIWASLTGGWSYEPSNSLFCNTVHLYTWFILFLTPLLIGIFANGNLSLSIFIGYIAFIIILFSLLKLIVSYLHRIFDTTDPIIKYTTGKKSGATGNNGSGEICRSPRSSLSGRGLSASNDYEMIDLGAERRRRRQSAPDREDEIEVAANSELMNVVLNINNFKTIQEDDSSSSGSSKRSHHELLDDKEKPRSNENFILPADSFELLPLSNRRTSEAPSNSRHPQSSFTLRKYSEPSFEALNVRPRNTCGNSNHRRDSTSSTSMRRVHSTNDAGQHHFQRRSSAYYLRDRHRRNSPLSITQSKPEFPFEKSKSEDRKLLPRQHFRKDTVVIEDDQQPCCSKSLQPSKDIEIGNIEKLEEEETASRRSSNMLRKIDKLNHSEEAANAEEDEKQGEDLKGKITKFLEELIDKHPETLDVIESVRQNRLGRSSHDRSGSGGGGSNGIGGIYPSDRALPIPIRSSRQRGITAQPNNTINNTFSANLRDGTHVAYDHEDTTEGAIHSFQDEHGTWWTYTFSDQGTGVAHPLGSTRAINELFSERMLEETVPYSAAAAAGKPHRGAIRHRRHASAAGVVDEYRSSRPSRATNNRRSESLTNDNKGYSAVTYIDSRPENETITTGDLERINDDNEQSSPGQMVIVEQGIGRRAKRRRRRRPRVHSSSSEEGGNDYISQRPTNIFHPTAGPSTSNSSQAGGDNSTFHRQIMTLANFATRLYPQPSGTMGANLNPQHASSFHPGGPGIGHGPQFFAVPQIRNTRGHLEAYADERRRRVLTVGELPNERGEYVRLQRENDSILTPEGPGRTSSLSSVNTMRIINDLSPLGAGGLRFTPRQSRVKANYYYRLKPFTLGEGLQVKLSRLSVAALFDRNNSIFSCIIDVVLAVMVAILAALLIARGVYIDFTLLIFSFVVAGSQFSLLKSVQPDAASPVHGFNWLVTYSRPVYFCILAFTTLLFDIWASKWSNQKNLGLLQGWTWNSYNNLEQSKMFIIISDIRDFFAFAILFLPTAFTVGLLPQITTLCMHIIEQIDMHFFGATASFSLFSATIAFLRSLSAIIFLTIIGYSAYYFDAQSTQNAFFSAFLAAVISMAYILSRWSSNPLFLSILFRDLMPWNLANCFSLTSTEEERSSEIQATTSEKLTKKPTNTLNVGTTVQKQQTPQSEIEENTVEPSPKNPATTKNIMGGFKNVDPLPEILKNTLAIRVYSDLLFTVVNTLAVFALHCTSVFSATQPYFEIIISILCITFGFVNHYFYRKLRTHTPWKIFCRPILKPHEFYFFESTVEAKLMLFERIHMWMLVVEKNILYPLLIASYMTNYAWILPFPVHYLPDPALAWISVPMSAIFSFRISRTAYAQTQLLYIPLTGAFVLSQIGNPIFLPPESRIPLPPGTIPSFLNSSEIYFTPLLVLYLFAAIWPKIQELTLKLNFVLAYIAPWQISWGSAFHAFAQPFSLPHSGMILVQAAFSSLISAPLNPFLGSSFFIMSYVRPVKFWEKDYNTKRVDHSNLRLSSQLDRGPMMDDSNLNAIFYEHLTRSLQQSLAGDLLLGRWGSTVHPGDCFILASLYLNCLVHIIEVGNGFVTFQVRGLEFRGTYCHQREVEAISEELNDGGGFCCCTVGSAPGLLSINNMFALRWLAWEVTASKYIIDGYSITDNSAVNLLQVHELRRLLVSLYVKCIIYYSLTSSSFDKWIINDSVLKALEPIIQQKDYFSKDDTFSAANDEDFDTIVAGITKQNFIELYGSWIQHCLEKRILQNPAESYLTDGEHAQIVTAFCFALSILGRRTLGAAAHNRHANAAESFLFGLHALFKGDLRITSPFDEWVCCDPDILSTVISPAVRMALKLHQDHFAADFDEISQLYERIEHYQTVLFISHEHDPAWRQAIISNTPSLLALRHMYDDGQDDYKIIMLNKMHLNMRVIKLNRECVRAFWSGQQQELIFLRNRNPERGSIQNARQVLRNMINSSADQPIGYPIYVSALMTSFIEGHSQMKRIIGPTVTFCTIANYFRRTFNRLRHHFGTSGSSNLPSGSQNIALNVIGPNFAQAGSTPAVYRKRATTGSVGAASAMGLAGSIGPERVEDTASVKTSASIAAGETAAGISITKIKKKSEEDGGGGGSEGATVIEPEKVVTEILVLEQKSAISTTTGEEIFVQISDIDKIFIRLNEPLRATGEMLVQWPSEEWRKKGGKNVWPNPIENGMRGTVSHIWKPFHKDRAFRSHAGLIYLVRMFPKNDPLEEPFYVPILEEGIIKIEKEDFLLSPFQSPETKIETSENNENRRNSKELSPLL
uniref:Pecanex-like protein n=1 Tax=Panagrolaimus sp. PS1159 TaxID=55785 RepID=A0AC35F273_9BILA